MKYSKNLLTAIIASTALLGCGSEDKKESSSDVVKTFTSVAAKGELLRYTVNETKKTFEYEIIDSAYGLNGKTGSGTYKVAADGSLTTSDAPNSKMHILPNGLVMGTVTEKFGPINVTTPFLGVENPLEDIAEGAGKYNYLGMFCSQNTSKLCTDYGTFQIKADSTWIKCDRDNNSDKPEDCSKKEDGTMEHLGDGRWQIMNEGKWIGTALMFKSGGQKVSLIDLRDSSIDGMGIGMIFASSQKVITDADNNGEWFYNDTNGISGTAKVIKNSYTTSEDNHKEKYEFTNNSPWIGIQTSKEESSDDHSIFTGTGVFMSEQDGEMLIGLKK